MKNFDPGQPSDDVRKHLGHLGLSDKELKDIEDLVHIQADIIVRGFWAKHKNELSAGQTVLIEKKLGMSLSEDKELLNNAVDTDDCGPNL